MVGLRAEVGFRECRKLGISLHDIAAFSKDVLDIAPKTLKYNSGFFRDPDQRILSGYYDETEPFASVLSQLTAPWMIGVVDLIVATGYCSEDLRYHLVGLPKVPLLEFAEGWKGGMTYQLVTEDDHGIPTTTPNRTKVTPADGLEAARRVREGFAFVGITEEWDLSICLFHRMFGGPCLGSDFEDTRPSSPGKSAHSEYNTSVLMGWHDDIDEIVYEAALEVFHNNLVLYNVSHDTCQECYRNAGIGDFA